MRPRDPAPRPRFRRASGGLPEEAPPAPPGDPAHAAHCLAQCQAWLATAVIGLNLCPFAKAVQARGQLRWRVSAAARPPDLLAELAQDLPELAAADPAAIDTTLVVLPWVLPRFEDFNAFLAATDALRDRLGLRGVLQIAAFHPRWRFAEHPPGDPAHATNRAPWPILHLLRESSVDRAVASVPDASAIYGRNIERLRGLGEAGWAELARAWTALPPPPAAG